MKEAVMAAQGIITYFNMKKLKKIFQKSGNQCLKRAISRVLLLLFIFFFEFYKHNKLQTYYQ